MIMSCTQLPCERVSVWSLGFNNELDAAYRVPNLNGYGRSGDVSVCQ